MQDSKRVQGRRGPAEWLYDTGIAFAEWVDRVFGAWWLALLVVFIDASLFWNWNDPAQRTETRGLWPLAAVVTVVCFGTCIWATARDRKKARRPRLEVPPYKPKELTGDIGWSREDD